MFDVDIDSIILQVIHDGLQEFSIVSSGTSNALFPTVVIHTIVFQIAMMHYIKLILTSMDSTCPRKSVVGWFNRSADPLLKTLPGAAPI